MKEGIKKMLAMLMVVCMTVTYMPTVAFAEDLVDQEAMQKVQAQIGGHFKADEGNGALGDSSNLTGETFNSYADGAVVVDKTIEPTDKENEFKVKLSVKTTESINSEVVSPDVATVIVIDISTSMNDNGGVKMNAAKKAAQEFINNYVDTIGESSRMVSIVSFSGPIYQNGVTGATCIQDWIEAGEIDTANSSVLYEKINRLRPNGGTNIEAGLILAKNLLNADAIKGIENKNVILFTDGEPTLGVKDREESNPSVEYICLNGTNVDGTADGVYCYTHEDIGPLVSTLKNTSKASTYAVYVGNKDVDCRECSLDKPIQNWLTDCGFTTYSTKNADQITSIFQAILNLIELKAQAWEATDPMGSTVDCLKVNRAPNPTTEYVYSKDGINWDLKGAEWTDKETVNGVTTFTYELEYTIKLDNLQEGFEPGTYYPTNGVTGVTYVVTEGSGDDLSYTSGTAYFNVPSVKGYENAVLQFKKVDATSKAALKGATFTLTAQDNPDWTIEATSDKDGMVVFNNLPSGHTYDLVETNVPEGYKGVSGTVTVSFGEVTCSIKNAQGNVEDPNETIDVSGTKTWVDNKNQDGKRPDSITINLYADGKLVETKKVTKADGWAWTFENVPTHNGGKKIEYTITEDNVAGYETKITGKVEDGFVVTNTHEIETTSIEVQKVWNDANNQDGMRKDSVTIVLKADGVATDKTVTLSEANDWTATFEDLVVYKEGAEGQKIQYAVEEVEVPEGYKAEVSGTVEDGFVVTNTHNVEKTFVEVIKNWVDNDNQDGIRPNSITINLFANGVKILTQAITPDANGNWSYVFENLDKFANGQEIKYEITEDEVDGYKGVVTGNQKDGYEVTNTHELEKTSVKVTKAWNDADNQDGIRPRSVVVTLFADGKNTGQTVTLDEINNWTATFTDLVVNKVNKVNEKVEYTVKELKVPDGYKVAVTGTAKDGFVVTNTHEVEKTSVEVTKAWNDADNQDGIRPASVVVTLLADGEATDKTVELNADNQWTATFTGLDVNKVGAVKQKVEYTVQELEVPEGYKVAVTGTAKDGFVVTNTHEVEKTSVEVTKAWNDADNQDGIRPASVVVTLLADGEATDKTVELNADNQWTATFTGLDVNKVGKEGQKVEYTVQELEVPEGYTVAVTGTAKDGFVVTNTHEVAKTSVGVTKVWNDADNQDGIRPTSVVVTLFADGEATDKTVELNADNQWTATFTGLDVNKVGKEGQKVEYTVQELEVPEGYTVAVTGTAKDGFVVTNTHEVAKTSVGVTKVWNDADNQDGIRPTSVVVTLFADGEATDKTVELNADNQWTATFTGLDVNKVGKEGQKVEYTVQELEVPEGYTVAVTGTAKDGFVVTNTHEVAKTSVGVTKVWNDADNQDGIRPTSVVVTLFADGEATDKTAELNADNQWTATFTGLDVNKVGKEGQKVEYTVQELEVPEGYTVAVTGTAKDGFVVTNTHEVEKIQVSGSKTWADANNQDGIRPDSITINLLADGVLKVTKTITPDAEGNWTWIFDNLDKFAAGEEIKYEITEDAVAGYETNVNGYDVTNKHDVDKTSVSVQKVWDDADNQDGIRPASVVVTLFADGEATDKTAELNAENQWTVTFEDLDVNKVGEEGQKVEYTVQELEVPEGYTVAITGDAEEGFVVTNTHEVEKTAVEVTKAWNDADNQDGIRPASVTVTLFADGEATDKTVELNADNQWTATFTGLDVNKVGKEGQKVEYTVQELEVPEGYTVAVTGTAKDGFVVTNTHEVAKTSVGVTKVWNDADNQDGIRPTSVVVTLFADGEATDKTVELNADNQWTATFTGLDVNKVGKEGQKVEYTVQELEVPEGYTVAVTGTAKDGFVVTNTHEVAKTSVGVTKVWNDADNQDGIRPTSVVVTLFADGEATDKTAELNADNQWTATFTGLDVNKVGKEGQKVEYTVQELEVPEGYTVAVTGTAKDGFVVTNTHEVAKTSVGVTKVWNDADNQDGIRPTSVVVTLFADGEATDKTAELNADNQWTATFTGLDVNKVGKEGQKVEYTVQELEVPEGYTVAVTGTAKDGFVVTNTHEVEKIQVSGSKTWADANNQDGIRPDSITINLLADGVLKVTKTITPDAEGNWTWIFDNLDKFAAGEEIKYEITEDAVAGYETNVNGYDVTNKHDVDKTSVSVQKVWDDADNQDGIRPASVVVTLFADGEATDKTAELNAENQWTVTFEDLDVNKVGEEGQKVEYTVQELEVPEGYTVAITGDAEEGFVVTNTHEVEKTAVEVTKAWNDADNQDGIRPASVTVTLFADGEATDKTVELNADNQWTATFEDLDVYKVGEEGQAVEYTVEENEVAGYEVEITGTATEGYVVTNTHTPETIELIVDKIWIGDSMNPDARPDQITVNLLADGEVLETVSIGEAEDWTYTFAGLQKFKAGEVIEYTVEEIEVKGYVSTLSGSAEDGGFTIVNSFVKVAEPVRKPKPEPKPEVPVPDTGDHNNLGMWVAILALSGCGVVAPILRKKEDEE